MLAELDRMVAHVCSFIIQNESSPSTGAMLGAMKAKMKAVEGNAYASVGSLSSPTCVAEDGKIVIVPGK